MYAFLFSMELIIEYLDVFVMQFFLSAADLELFEHEVDRANRKELLDQVTKNLPVHCRLISGGHQCLLVYQ
jgi:hypothetical protein